MRIAAVIIATTLVLGSSVKAQDKTETTVYKVDFNIHDGRDSAAKAGRRYTLLVRNNNKSTFRVGDKIPYATSSGTQAAQYSYLDTGVNIDCVARELNEKVALFAEVELSRLAGCNRRAQPDRRPIQVCHQHRSHPRTADGRRFLR